MWTGNRSCAVLFTMLTTCNIHIAGDSSGLAGVQFSDSVNIPGSTPYTGDLPSGTFPYPGASSSTAPMISPGGSFNIPIPTGGNVRAVNISFGGGRYFQVPANGRSSVSANAGDFCSNLADVCHQISCYEQVVTSEGTYSQAMAQQMVLNCTGGTDCNGNASCQCTGGGSPCALQTCVCSDLSGYYLVNGRRFPYSATDQASVTRAAEAATNFTLSSCR